MRVIRFVWSMSAGIFASAVLCTALCLFLSCSDDGRKIVVCWGDSLTSPGYKNNYCCPLKLFHEKKIRLKPSLGFQPFLLPLLSPNKT